MVNLKEGLCECMQGALKGPCKHKSLVAQRYKMKNFEMLPKANENMRAFYYFLGTGIEQETTWFRPLQEEEEVPLVDWSDNVFDEDEAEHMSVEQNLDEEPNNMSISTTSSKPESDEQEDPNTDSEFLASMKKSMFCFIYTIQNIIGNEREQLLLS